MVDSYLYPNTNVLKNKLNITEEEKLANIEYAYVSLNISSLLNNPIRISTVFDIFKIHKILFEDLYEWAGKCRSINIYKDEPVLAGLSVEYSDYSNIKKDLECLDKEFKTVNWVGLSKKQIINKLVLIISKLWKIHCFREGNTRAVTTFLYLFIKQINLKVDIKFIGDHAKYFRNALVLASIGEYSEYQHLERILLDSTLVKNVKDNQYKTIREYDVEKYEYRHHKYKK